MKAIKPMNIMSNTVSLFAVSVLLPVVIGGDMSLLCAEDQPIDAAFMYQDVTFVIKKSNVWRYLNKYIGPDSVNGPTPLSKIFVGKEELDSIDGVFHINADSTTSTDPNWRTMCSIAIVFRKSKYHIFQVQKDKQDKQFFNYYYYNYSVGVPLGIPVGSGQIKFFKEADQRPVDAVFFNRDNSEAVVTAETDLYVLSGFKKDEAFKNKTKNPVKKKMKNILGLTEKISAAMDINNVGSVILIFDKYYCEINISNPICRKKSIVNDWFRCDQIKDSGPDSQTETQPTEQAKPADAGRQKQDSDNNITSTSQTKDDIVLNTPKTNNAEQTKVNEEPSAKNESKMVIIVVAVVGAILLIIVIAMLVICLVRPKSKGSEPGSAKGGKKVSPKEGRASELSKKTTFSTAFGPSN